MDRIEEIIVFTTVAELGGFASASRKLNLSAPTVTRAIAALEERLGVELFVRTTRFVRLTDVGEIYLQDCRRIVRDLEESEAQAKGAHSEPMGTLSIAAPIVFGQRILMPLLVEFLLRYPALTVHTLLVDRVVQLAEEGIDVAFRMGELPDSAMVAIPLGFIRRIVCASPSYLEHHGRPQRPQDITQHQCVVSSADGRGDRWLFNDGGTNVDIAITPRLLVSNNEAAIVAAEHGGGLTRVMSYQVAEHLHSGRLERVLQNFEAKPLPVWLLSQEGRRAAAKQRCFTAFASEYLRQSAALLG